MLVGCVSFDCHPGSPFFLTSETHVVISSVFVSYPFDTTRSLSLSLQKLGHSYSDNNTRSLSSQKVTLSICVLRCPRRPVAFATASCAHSEDCATVKGARADADSVVLRASDPPPRSRSARVESPRQGGN
jgi:hypothetical protein